MRSSLGSLHIIEGGEEWRLSRPLQFKRRTLPGEGAISSGGHDDSQQAATRRSEFEADARLVFGHDYKVDPWSLGSPDALMQ